MHTSAPLGHHASLTTSCRPPPHVCAFAPPHLAAPGSPGKEFKHTPGVGAWANKGDWIDVPGITKAGELAGLGISADAAEDDTIRDLPCKAGTVVLFDARLIHGAHPNMSTRSGPRHATLRAPFCHAPFRPFLLKSEHNVWWKV